MVVLRPLVEGERMKRCSRCGHVGLCSPVRERSSFAVTSRRGRREYLAPCRWCEAARVAAYERENREKVRASRRARTAARRAARLADPVLLEADRRVWREKAAKSRETRPELRRAADRRYRERVNADPERVERRRKAARRRQAKRAAARRQGGGGVALPIGPFRRWVEILIARESLVCDCPERRVAELIGITERQLYGYRFEPVTVKEATVDRACSREGSIMLWELYPERLTHV